MQNISRAHRGSAGHDDPKDFDLAQIHRVDRPQSITSANSNVAQAYAFRLNIVKRSQSV
jgi:hypothetical protein